jgi:hypothetical protein
VGVRVGVRGLDEGVSGSARSLGGYGRVDVLVLSVCRNFAEVGDWSECGLLVLGVRCNCEVRDGFRVDWRSRIGRCQNFPFLLVCRWSRSSVEGTREDRVSEYPA